MSGLILTVYTLYEVFLCKELSSGSRWLHLHYNFWWC